MVKFPIGWGLIIENIELTEAPSAGIFNIARTEKEIELFRVDRT
jgi:hypothetical protein